VIENVATLGKDVILFFVVR